MSRARERSTSHPAAVLRGGLAVLLLCAGCAPQRAPDPPFLPLQSSSGFLNDAGGPPRRTIRHIVWVMQENRSFDNLFQGYPGADTRSSGEDSHGRTIRLQARSFASGYDIDHSSVAYFAACNGTGSIPGTNCRMNGFDDETVNCSAECPTHPQYAYVPHSETKLYFEMAHRYVLGDRMFASHLDASYISHQYMIAGQANHAVDFPTGAWGCTGGSNTITTLTALRGNGPSIPTCQNYQTLGDELDAAGRSWRLYSDKRTSEWIAYRSIRHIRFGPDWRKDIVGSSVQFIADVNHGQLADMTWVTPACIHSDHAVCESTSGPEWVADVVNALGQSPFWDTTAIFVMWDEWGGWYDHVRPPYADFDGLGFRVPLLVISPYAKRGYVSHVQYEHGSLLRFIEDCFGLPRLAASDSRANSPTDAFDFSQPPRRFVPFGTSLRVDDLARMERAAPDKPADAE